MEPAGRGCGGRGIGRRARFRGKISEKEGEWKRDGLRDQDLAPCRLPQNEKCVLSECRTDGEGGLCVRKRCIADMMIRLEEGVHA